MPILTLSGSSGVRGADLASPQAKVQERIRRARLISFDNTTWTAVVQLDGSMSNTDLPVGQWVTADIMLADSYYAVLLLDDTNPDDGLIIGPFGKVGALTGAREKLTAARTYYVRTDGSDSNNGLANTAGGAFLTLQKAIDVISDTLDLRIYNVTIQVANGTYTTAAGTTLKNCIGAGTVTILGDAATPANVVIHSTGNAAFNLVYTDGGATIYAIKGAKFTAAGTNPYAIAVLAVGLIYVLNVEFGAAFWAHLFVKNGGRILATGPYTISASCVTHLYALAQSSIDIAAQTITLTGTPAWSFAFATSTELARIKAGANTFSGAATGPRYYIDLNAIIQTVGGGANYFPGNAAGSTASGGQYA